MSWTTDAPPTPAVGRSLPERAASVAAANAYLTDRPGDEHGAVRAGLAAMVGIQKLSAEAEPREYAFTKADDALRIVWGEVYLPGVPDSEGDFMTADEIRKMAHAFLRSGLVDQIDVNHDYEMTSCRVVESFIARSGDPDFMEGAWVMATHIPDDKLWAAVMEGDLNGYSMAGWSTRTEGELLLDVPNFFVGRTDTPSQDHDHAFKVFFDQQGQFLGGETSIDVGHRHVIERGTVTEPAGEDGHVHWFSFVEALVA